MDSGAETTFTHTRSNPWPTQKFTKFAIIMAPKKAIDKPPLVFEKQGAWLHAVNHESANEQHGTDATRDAQCQQRYQVGACYGRVGGF